MSRSRRDDGVAAGPAAGAARAELDRWLANKVLAKVADRVLCAFPDALPDSEWTGNPVRAGTGGDAGAVARPSHRPLRILVVGGSLGAAALNDVVPKALALLPEASARRSRTRPARNRSTAARELCGGRRGGERAVHRRHGGGLCRRRPGDLPRRRHDRVGVAAAGVASVFVPFPHAVDDHQTTNASSCRSRAPRCWCNRTN
jgi:UDP-N-acetylglucosamine--N-acetylmuramyl-(pentapeptide) pyrophosphoryl-undecaprenol N-acetylglucosamine transferase